MNWIKELFNFKINHKQADQISAWIFKNESENQAWVVISNLSSLPVYKMILSIVNIQGDASDGKDTPNAFRTYLSIIPPGKSYTKIEIHHGMSFVSGIEIAFEDFNKNYWVRTGDNILKSTTSPPYKYYGLSLPLSWQIPKIEMV